MSSEALTYKTEGNAKLSSGDVRGAIASFTKAIELDDSNHIFYSNRSAAYLRLRDVDNALKDAVSCVNKKPDWAKGHGRKGRAYFEKKMFGKAAEAYRRALDLDPSNAEYKKAVATTEQEDKYQRGIEQRPTAGTTSSTPEAPSTTASTSTSSSTSSSAPTRSFRDTYLGSRQAMTNLAVQVCRLGFVLGVVAFIFAFNPSLSSTIFRFSLFLACGLYLTQVVVAHGKPQFNQEYAQRALRDWRMHYAMLSILSLSSHPRTLVLLPMFVMEIGNVAEFCIQTLPSPLLSTLNNVIVAPVIPRILKVTPEDWINMPSSTKWQRHNTAALSFAANFELVNLLMLIVDIFTPRRNLLGLFAYAQFLRMRYMLSPQLQEAFTKFDQRIAPLLAQVPLVGPYYQKAKALLGSMVDPEKLQSAAGSSPKCSIM